MLLPNRAAAWGQQGSHVDYEGMNGNSLSLDTHLTGWRGWLLPKLPLRARKAALSCKAFSNWLSAVNGWTPRHESPHLPSTPKDASHDWLAETEASWCRKINWHNLFSEQNVEVYRLTSDWRIESQTVSHQQLRKRRRKTTDQSFFQ